MFVFEMRLFPLQLHFCIFANNNSQQPIKNDQKVDAVTPSPGGGASQPRNTAGRALQQVPLNVAYIPVASPGFTGGAAPRLTNVIKRRKGLIEDLNRYFIPADDEVDSLETKDGHHEEINANHDAGILFPDQQSQYERSKSPQYTLRNTVGNTATMRRIAPGTAVKDPGNDDAERNASSTLGEYKDEWLEDIDGEIRPRTATSPAFCKFSADRAEQGMSKVPFKDVRKVLKSGIHDMRSAGYNASSTDKEISGLKRRFSDAN